VKFVIQFWGVTLAFSLDCLSAEGQQWASTTRTPPKTCIDT